MLRRPTVSVIIALVLTSVSSANGPDADLMLQRIGVLASPAMEGRGNGTDAALAAADSVAAWFDAAGLEVPAAGRFQDFDLQGEGFEGLVGRNVAGILPGAGDLADRIVVIGAHYDHLGLRRDDAGEVTGHYAGAEDNASGVAALCEAARLLGSLEGDRRTVVVLAFAGEEIGLLGSRHVVEHPIFALDAVDLMLNLDSVGRLREDRLYVGGVGSAEGLRDLVTAVNADFGLDLEMSEGGWDASDHVAFNTAGIPVLFLFTGAHPQYHSVDDTPDLIEAEGLARVTSFATALASAVASRAEPMVYRAVADLPDRPAAAGERPKRPWLGSIPDFVDAVEGVKLAGVMPGSPAEEAGLVKGDVIVGFDDDVLTSLQDLTVALQTRREGDMVKVIYIRDGERREAPVVLRPRPR